MYLKMFNNFQLEIFLTEYIQYDEIYVKECH